MPSKVDQFDRLYGDLLHQYPRWPSTFSMCIQCDEHPARGGGICAHCIENEMAMLIGPTDAAHLHAMVKQLNEKWHLIAKGLKE